MVVLVQAKKNEAFAHVQELKFGPFLDVITN
jgi:hypothetical protein